MPTTITRSGVRISQNENFSSYEDTMVEGEQTKIEVTDLVPDTTYYAKGLAEANNEIFVADNYIRFRTAQFQYDYLTFTAEDTSTIAMRHDGTNETTTKPVIYYSFDKEEWNTWDFEAIELDGGQSVYMYGENPNGVCRGFYNNYSRFVMTGSILGSGNTTTLIQQGGSNQVPEYGLAGLFYGCESLKTAPAIPSKVLADGCYQGMFALTSITQAPALPAKTLYDYCYASMFYSCSRLVKAPTLPATQAKPNCYAGMFASCTSLTQAPQLPASIGIGTSCYAGMFRNCTSLVTAPELRGGVYFRCYESMFQGCTSLVNPPSILPATTGIQDSCYYSMFAGCTSLEHSPIMSCTWLARDSCKYMFAGCTSLKTITCMLTDISAQGCLDGWVDGVAEDGTFYKNPEMDEWRIGTNGIPSGWTVLDYEP